MHRLLPASYHRAIHRTRLLLALLLVVWGVLPPHGTAAQTAATTPASAVAASGLSATLTDSLAVDADASGRPSAGDTLRYTLDITNTGDQPIAAVTADLGLDANTSLDASSIRVSPLAFAENYATGRDTALAIAAPGLLANDTGTTPLAIAAGTVATVGGGTAQLAADGSFSYTPAAGYTGVDSFVYRVSNSVGQDSSTVMVQVDSAPSIIGVTPADGSSSVPVATTVVISFDEPVNLAPDSLALSCDSIAVPFDLTSGPAASFTIDPTGDLPGGAACTLTVTAANVSDADALDPPDTLAADASFRFATIDAAPRVTATVPTDGAMTFSAQSNLSVSFDQTVDLTAGAFALTCASAPIAFATAPTLPASGVTSIIIDPSAPLPINSSCALTVVASGVRDSDTNDPPDALPADVVVNFTTNDAAPAVTTTTPSDGATGVGTSAPIVVRFDEPVTFAADAFVIACPGPVTFAVSGSGTTSATLTPSANLPQAATCTVTVSASKIHDADSIDPPDTMLADVSLSFATDAAPTVVSSTPTSGATNVATSSAVTIIFSEPVAVASGGVTLSCGGAVALSGLPFSGTTLTVTPTAALPNGASCTATIVAAKVTDLDAADPPDAMAANVSFTFSTIAADAAPQIVSTSPANATAKVALTTPIVITFSEPVDLTASAVALACPGPMALGGLPASGVTTVTLTPATSIAEGATCTVTVTASQVTDSDTNDPPDTLAADYSFGFTADRAPTVMSTVPASGAAGIGESNNIVINFSEPVSFGAGAFTIACPAGSPVAFAVTGSGTASATLNPSANLPLDTLCAVTALSSGIGDTDAADPPNALDGNADGDGSDADVDNYSFSFRTRSIMLTAANDTFGPIIGNIAADSSAVSFSVLTNDTLNGATIASYDASSGNGGSVTLNTGSGTFSYNPPAGFKGTDSFSYTISNGSASSTATVSIVVANIVWFVDDAASNGDGRYGSPLNDSAAGLGSIDTSGAADPDSANDLIFVYSGSYSRGFALESGQRLVGQGVSLSAALAAYGIALPASQSIAGTAAGSAPTMRDSADVVVLGPNTDVRGLALIGSGGAAVAGSGALGASRVSDVSIGTSGGLGNGIALTSSGGSVSFARAPVAVSSLDYAVLIDGGAATVSFDSASTVTQSGTGGIVAIQNRSGGGVSFGGTVSGTTVSAAPAIRLNANLGSVTFAGTITITASRQRALDVTSGGSFALTMSGGGSALRSSFSKPGVISIVGAGPTALDVQIQTVTATDGGTAANRPDTAIALQNTTGSFRITGSGTSLSSGGAIAGTNGTAITLDQTAMTALELTNLDIGQPTACSTSSRPIPTSAVQIGKGGSGDGITIGGGGGIALTRVRIACTANSGIGGTNVAGLSITGGLLRSNGTSTGDSAVTLVYNGGVSAALSIRGSTFGNSGGAAIAVRASAASAVGSLAIQQNTIAGDERGIDLQTSGGGTIGGVSIQQNSLSGVGTQIGIVNSGTSTGSTIRGTVLNNTLASSGPTADALLVRADGAGAITLDLGTNTVTSFGSNGLLIDARGASATIDAQVRTNTIAGANASNGQAALALRSGAASGDASRLCVNLIDNRASVAGATAPIADYSLARVSGGAAVFQIQNLTPSPASATQAAAYAAGTDIDFPTAVADAGTYLAASCAAPQLAAGGQGPGAAPTLEQATLDAALAQAVARWKRTDLGASHSATLEALTARVAQLGPGRLGETIGGSIAIDDDAAGWGWGGRQFDLLTVVLHEVGHTLGLDDRATQSGELMSQTIAPTERREAQPNAGESTVTIGALPAGKHVRVVYDARIAAPLPPGVAAIVAQASIGGGGITPTRSDDPRTPPPGDATTTTVGHLLYLPQVRQGG